MERLCINPIDTSETATAVDVVHNLECQFGLLTRIVESKFLSERQLSEIRRPNSTQFEQNDKLLEFMKPLLTDETKRNRFRKLLCDTLQSHLADYVCGKNGTGASQLVAYNVDYRIYQIVSYV